MREPDLARLNLASIGTPPLAAVLHITNLAVLPTASQTKHSSLGDCQMSHMSSQLRCWCLSSETHRLPELQASAPRCAMGAATRSAPLAPSRVRARPHNHLVCPPHTLRDRKAHNTFAHVSRAALHHSGHEPRPLLFARTPSCRCTEPRSTKVQPGPGHIFSFATMVTTPPTPPAPPGRCKIRFLTFLISLARASC